MAESNVVVTPPRKHRLNRERTTAQVRTIARRANMELSDFLVKLRAANVQAIDGGPLYATSKVDLDAAMAALQRKAESDRPVNPIGVERAAAAAATVAPTLIRDQPAYTGDDTQTRPQYIVEGAYDDEFSDFPPIPNPDPDKLYRPIYKGADRQDKMVRRGYQFVKDPAHIRRIGLGTLERYINERGRIQYKDRELGFLDMDIANERRRRRHEAWFADRAAVGESFDGNIDSLRRGLGRGADSKLTSFTMSEGEALERQEAAESARAGVKRIIVDVGGGKAKE